MGIPEVDGDDSRPWVAAAAAGSVRMTMDCCYWPLCRSIRLAAASSSSSTSQPNCFSVE